MTMMVSLNIIYDNVVVDLCDAYSNIIAHKQSSHSFFQVSFYSCTNKHALILRKSDNQRTCGTVAACLETSINFIGEPIVIKNNLTQPCTCPL